MSGKQGDYLHRAAPLKRKEVRPVGHRMVFGEIFLGQCAQGHLRLCARTKISTWPRPGRPRQAAIATWIGLHKNTVDKLARWLFELWH